MPSRWTPQEENEKRAELKRLYVSQNRSISEIAELLDVGESTVYDRMVRLGMPSLRHLKTGYNNIHSDITIPRHSPELAEFIGIMLGDGALNPTQIHITINGEAHSYIRYVRRLIKSIFGIMPNVIPRKDENARCIYFGSTAIVQYLLKMGLTFNKVKSQVGIPK